MVISYASWNVYRGQIISRDLLRIFLAQKSFEQNGKTFFYFLAATVSFMM